MYRVLPFFLYNFSNNQFLISFLNYIKFYPSSKSLLILPPNDNVFLNHLAPNYSITMCVRTCNYKLQSKRNQMVMEKEWRKLPFEHSQQRVSLTIWRNVVKRKYNAVSFKAVNSYVKEKWEKKSLVHERYMRGSRKEKKRKKKKLEMGNGKAERRKVPG